MYSLHGKLIVSTGLGLFILGVMAGYCGRKVAIIIATTYRRPSVTVFAISLVFLCSLILLLVDIFTTHNAFSDLAFHNYCEELS